MKDKNNKDCDTKGEKNSFGIKTPTNKLFEKSGDGNIKKPPINPIIIGAVKNLDVSEYLSPKEAKKMDVFIHYGMAAGIQAFEDSGLEVNESNAERIGVAIGAGIGGISTIEKTADLFREKGPKRISPFFVPSSIIKARRC